MPFKGKLYVTANDGATGCEVWQSNGKAEGTVLVQDIRPRAGSSYGYVLTPYKKYLLLVADNGTTGRELWKIDPKGTAAAAAPALIPPPDVSGDGGLIEAIGSPPGYGRPGDRQARRTSMFISDTLSPRAGLARGVHL